MRQLDSVLSAFRSSIDVNEKKELLLNFFQGDLETCERVLTRIEGTLEELMKEERLDRVMLE